MSLEIRRLKSTIKKINEFKNKYVSLSDSDLLKESESLKLRFSKEGDSLLPEAFALVKEASRRAIGKEHYDVQLMSGIVLYKGKIAEAKTGEGKTITIYLPAYLGALSGKGVHVVTVNDYLANRDALEAQKVFSMLGVSVGCVLNDSSKEERQFAYNCDITYVTNTELGFDYLRDNIANDRADLVLRDFNYAIIDEIDSVLIDEAKTPLIISGSGPDVGALLSDVDSFVKSLNEGELTETTTVEKIVGYDNIESGDYVKNLKDNQIYLTEQGIENMVNHFGVENYNSGETLLLQRMVNNALRANYLMSIDKDYIVRDNKVEIVDTYTGRVLPGRRFSDGLHQSLEVKENVEIQPENQTIATVTFQSFFNKYAKKSGLTGTAMTSSKEFKSIYALDVVEIPTNKPVIRKDLPDAVYRTKNEKWQAVVNAVIESHEHNQPVLIGTASIEDSELLSKLLTKKGIEHNVLNAKNEALEAEIVSKAGQAGAVTVATNMAGRGTDILLDDKARAAGGLRVIGTERHDSKRIDNQLKGRSGRQGDPGESQFLISLEDRIIQVFGAAEKLDTLMMFGTAPGQPIQFKSLSKLIAKSQEAVETENRLARENMIQFDSANNEYREQIYSQRREILTTSNPRAILEGLFDQISDEIVDRHVENKSNPKDWDINAVFDEYFNKVACINIDIDTSTLTKSSFKDAMHKVNRVLINLKEQELQNPHLSRFVERTTLLRFIDRNWVMFLGSMECVKQNISSQAYGERSPAVEYGKKGTELFNAMIENIKSDTILNFMRCAIVPPERQDLS